LLEVFFLCALAFSSLTRRKTIEKVTKRPFVLSKKYQAANVERERGWE
jgi:hypothetical protein